MPGPTLVVLLALDGVVHVSDLPVQAFARHITEQLAPDQVRPIIAGMRGFLECKTELIPAGIDLTDAEDGYQAVQILARTAGLVDSGIAAARRASRVDLAASAWAVDPADGLDELLALLAGRATVVVQVEPGDPAVSPLLDAIDLAGEPSLVESDTGAAVRNLLAGGSVDPADPRRLLAIGARWRGDLEAAAAAGCTTALVDRFNRGAGRPTWRATGLADFLDPIRTWLEQPSGALA